MCVCMWFCMFGTCSRLPKDNTAVTLKMFVFACAHACMYMSMQVYMCVCLCMYMRMNLCTYQYSAHRRPRYACIWTHKPTHTYTYIDVHTHICLGMFQKKKKLLMILSTCMPFSAYACFEPTAWVCECIYICIHVYIFCCKFWCMCIYTYFCVICFCFVLTAKQAGRSNTA